MESKWTDSLINVCKFPNGFTIIYEKSKSKTLISSIQVYCKTGSANEPDHLRGVAHMIEHMCFKGTKNHPNANSIFNVSIGSDFNAYTDKMLTCYYMQCLNKNLNSCIGILSDIMLNSFFHKEHYAKEKSVVEEENIKNSDELDVIINEEMEAFIFKNTPYQYPIDTLKYHHSKSSLPLKSVVEYYKRHYVPENMVVSIYSCLSLQTILSYLKKTDFNTGNRISFLSLNIGNLQFPRRPSLSLNTGKRILVIKKNTATTYISLGFKTCEYTSPDKYSLEVFNTILSGGMNSYLFTLLREKNGLTYSSYVDTNYFDSVGSFAIYAEVDKHKVMKNGTLGKGVLPLLVDTISHFHKNGITKKQLENAKKIIEESMIRDLQDMDTKPQYNAIEYILSGEIIPYDVLFERKYKNISVSTVNNVVRKYFVESNMKICIVG
jgi:predicted Zn-dependent peptidase